MNGSSWNGKVNRYWVPASDGTAMFIGDIVKLAGVADADGTQGVIQAAAGNTPVGVVVSFEPNPDNLMQVHRIASQNVTSQNAGRWVFVADSPDLVMEVQEDGDGGTIPIGDSGTNADMIVAAGSATTGLSGMEIDSSTTDTTSTLVFRILGWIPRPDNEVGVAEAKLKVGFNVHQYGSVGTAGVA